MYLKYLLQVVLFALLFSIPLSGNWLFLVNSGELLSMPELVRKQMQSKNNCIAGLATRNQSYAYKKAMYEYLKPEVFILGSSRVMQFRQVFFSSKIANVGGALGSLNDAYSFTKEVLSNSKPQLILFGVDYWWFNAEIIKPTTEIKPPLHDSGRISLQKYILPYKWLIHSKISKDEYFEILSSFNFQDQSHLKTIGLDGLLNHSGFGQDGSYYYTKKITGKDKSADEQFSQSFSRIKNNQFEFKYGQTVDPIHLKNFMDLVQFISQKNIPLIIFFPPLAPSVIAQMEKMPEQYAYIQDIKAKLDSLNVKYYDFHNPASLNTTDCEFVDGIHGGDLLYARIIEAISREEPLLAQHLNLSKIKELTNGYQGLAMIPNPELMASPEIDFLKIGCQKT